MKWARAQNMKDIEIIHIRDWHDPNVHEEGDHLQLFGKHCIQNTPGAELVLGLGKEVEKRENEHFVNVSGFNDFAGSVESLS
jgi:nicotinamidase-related amidase